MGPLHGVRVLEIASVGPGPFAAMMLADMGADIVRLERPGGMGGSGSWNYTNRGRESYACDLKTDEGRALALRLASVADALLEGFRPGVMERLGLGPDVLLRQNPRLVYGRMTGYGQEGPMAQAAGHDINYIAIAGALAAFRRANERPMFPLNTLGDYGGGGMLLAFGLVCAVLEARHSGEGQVVDAAMVDGTAILTTLFHGMRAAGLWSDQPGTNTLDGGAHFYDVYETADGGHVAVGAIEPQFYAELLRRLELDADAFPQMEQERWPEFKQRFAAMFRAKTRAEWAEIFEHAEACVTAVYPFAEAPNHPHNRARHTFLEVPGGYQPAPAPRFSRTTAQVPSAPPSRPNDASDQALARWGLGPS
jgi:alpha-methylacyl-CoA racemase